MKYYYYILTLLFCLICYCASNSEAEEIFVSAELTRTLGKGEVDLLLQYHASPVANYSIDEVWLGDSLIAEPKKRGQATIGACDVILSVQNVEHRQKVELDQNIDEISIKTKWRGMASEELIVSQKIPRPFEVLATSSEVSPSQPLKIELRNSLVETDWDACYLAFSKKLESGPNERFGHIQLFSPQRSAERLIEISLDKIIKHNNTRESQIYFKLICEKEHIEPQKEKIQGPIRHFSSNSFRYKLKTPKYLLTILD